MEPDTVVIIVKPPEPVSVAGETPEKKAVGVDEKNVECEKEVDKSSCVIDVKFGGEDEKLKEDEEEMVICRICHLNSDQAEFQKSLIQLGCGCKGELGVAHIHCGEAWFKLKGNRTCEICGQAATNITGIENSRFIEEWNENSPTETIAETSRDASGCWRGQRFCNFLMACLVIAFILPWFFRISMF